MKLHVISVSFSSSRFVSFYFVPFDSVFIKQLTVSLQINGSAAQRFELELGSYLMLYASGYRMSRSAQGSKTDSGDYSKYVFHVHI